MLGLLFASPLLFLIIFPGLLLAITIHEFAHAWAADKLGDPTPRIQDRLTLDPRAHLDPIGTLAILITRFGWGRPVEFDPYYLKDPVRDTALISLAGPVSNILVAIILAIVLRFIPDGMLLVGLYQVLYINIILAIFNLVPVYPLDGSKILQAVLPTETSIEYQRFMSRYGMMVLILLLLPWNGVSPIGQLIGPIIDAIMSLLVW